ncbi:MAG: extracellular solute-binding protein [Bacteroidetes bacterium]|nr:extracellular solute-binding protein [Bacteroidota bacterium]
MKTNNIYRQHVLIAVAVSFFLSSFTLKENASSGIDNLEGTISVSGAFALYPIVVKWGEEFKKLHPNVKFDISAGGAGKGISDVLGGMVDLGAVSRDIYPEETKKGAFSIAVTKDAVVATVNSNNPNIRDVLSKGLKKDAFANIYASGTYRNWKQTGFSISAPIHIYTRSDAAGAAESWAKYFGKKQEDLLGIGVYGDPGLLSAVKKDPIAIGFNNISYVYNPKTKKQLSGITVVPIDVNNNGKIDADENFYGTLDEFIKAVSEGKYPSPPARDLYLVSKNKPQKKVVVEFLKWVLTEGQKFVNEAGYIKLSDTKLKVELTKVGL